MSYILDALRKSDQQRRRAVAPGLLAPQATATVPGIRVSMSHALLAAVLIGAGIVIGALRPWQAGEPAPAAESGAMKPLESSLPTPSEPVPVRPQGRSEQDMPAQKTASAERPALAHAAGTTERRASAAAKPAKKAQTRDSQRVAVTAGPKKTARTASEERGPAGTGDVAREQKILTIAELPQSIRQEIPQMSISVHAYSHVPERRLIGINDRVLREGEFLAPGLMLEQITLDGVIMRYNEYRFRRGVR